MKTQNKTQNEVPNDKGENEMEMASKMYSKGKLTEAVANLGIKSEYEIKDSFNRFSVIFLSKDGYRNVQVDLNLDFNVGRTAAFHVRHPFMTVYDITGFEISVNSIRTEVLWEADFLLEQYQDGMKVAKLFNDIVREQAILIESI